LKLFVALLGLIDDQVKWRRISKPFKASKLSLEEA